MIETGSNGSDYHSVDEFFFPGQLYRMLEDAGDTQEGFSNVISWVGNVGFKLHSKQKFESSVLSKYFKKQTKCKSFLRQLNLWGFHRVTGGQYKGVYTHKTFRQGMPETDLKQIRRPKRDSFGSIILDDLSKAQEDEKSKNNKTTTPSSSSSSRGRLSLSLVVSSNMDGRISPPAVFISERGNVVSPVSSVGSDLSSLQARKSKNLQQLRRKNVHDPLKMTTNHSLTTPTPATTRNAAVAATVPLLRSQELPSVSSSSSIVVSEEEEALSVVSSSSSSSTSSSSLMALDDDSTKEDHQSFIQFGNFGFFPPDVTTMNAYHVGGSSSF